MFIQESGAMVETGQGIGELLGSLGAETLADPALQGALELSIANALASPQVKSAMRPYFIEGAAWAAVGILAALFVFKLR